MLSCLCSGLFECQDPSTESRNLSLGEFKKQIKEDNVSGKANTHQGLSNKLTFTRQVVSPFLVVVILYIPVYSHVPVYANPECAQEIKMSYLMCLIHVDTSRNY